MTWQPLSGLERRAVASKSGGSVPRRGWGQTTGIRGWREGDGVQQARWESGDTGATRSLPWLRPDSPPQATLQAPRYVAALPQPHVCSQIWPQELFQVTPLPPLQVFSLQG